MTFLAGIYAFELAMKEDWKINGILAEEIAATAFETYTKCPSRTKPTRRSDGTPEWTNLAAIVLVKGRKKAYQFR